MDRVWRGGDTGCCWPFQSKGFKNKDGKTIVVEEVTVSQIGRCLLAAAAGGNASDVTGVWTWMLTIYADKGDLISLDDYLVAAQTTKDGYLPVFLGYPPLQREDVGPGFDAGIYCSAPLRRWT